MKARTPHSRRRILPPYRISIAARCAAVRCGGHGLDATTNWAVVTTGLALSLTFSSETVSPLPLVLVGLLVAVFLLIEGDTASLISFGFGRISWKCISSARSCAGKACGSTTAGTR